MKEATDSLVDFGEGKLTHLPGLDGLRGLAVTAVVLFHGNWPWMRGGYLGVSLFFTLSGFLITSLLLEEHRRTGRIHLWQFWSRRFRRLLPAAWVTIGAVVAAIAWLGDAADVARLRVDTWAALGQVSNWRFLLAGSSYSDLFRAPPPLLHFWSLAIEEQFYVVFPFLVVCLLAIGRSRRVLTVGLTALAAWSVISPHLFGWSLDRLYYGTDTRAFELLVGALLAIVYSHRSVRTALARRLIPRSTFAGLGVAAGVAMLLAWVGLEQTDPLVANGGLALHALAAALVITAATLPAGPVRYLCTSAPLRYLGRVSYAVYLVHWPLLALVTTRRTGLDRLPRFLLVVAASLVLAEVSRRVIETPIRERRGVLGWRRLQPRWVAPFVVLGLIGSPLAVTSSGRATVGFDEKSTQERLAELSERSRRSTTTTPTTAPQPPTPVVAPYGDSVALTLGLAVGEWGESAGQLAGTLGVAALGCGIARGGQRRNYGVETISKSCDSWATTWAAALSQYRPDMVMVYSQWELYDRKMVGDTTWRTILDPTFAAYVESEFLAANDLLATAGGPVVWFTIPYYGHSIDDQLPPGPLRARDPKRVDALNAIIRRVVAARPDSARLIDLASYMTPYVEDTSIRADGEHFDSNNGTNRAAAEFVGPQLVNVWNDWWLAHR